VTILGLVRPDEHALPLVGDLSRCLAIASAPGAPPVYLARTGTGTDGYVDPGVRVVCDGRQGPTAQAIAARYRRDGPDCVRQLTGTFAFVLYDAHRQILVAATDLVSRAPLAYWFERDSLVVCSSVLRVLDYSRGSRALDESYLAHLVTGFWAASPGTTALHGVKRLPLGTALVAGRDRVELRVVDRLARRGPPSPSKRGCAEAFWQELDEAVVRSTTGTEPACLSLSGGLDSAALGSSIARHAEPSAPIPAFSMVAPSRGVDEEAAIRELEEVYGSRVTNTRLDCTDAVDLTVLDSFELQDDPAMTPLAYLPSRLRLWQAAKTAGLRVVLDGEGGDELFGMICGPRDALLEGQWLTAWNFLRRHRARHAVFARGFILPASPGWLRQEWARRRARSGERLPSYLSQRARNHPAVAQASVQFYESQIGEDRTRTLEEWLSNPAVIGSWRTHQHLAAQHALTLVSPLLDRRVVELILGIPSEWMLATESKSFLRGAAAERIPERIRTQPKAVALPFALLRDIVGSPAVRAMLGDPCVRDRLGEWIRFERLESMIERIAQGFDPPDPLLWQQLEGLVSFAYWYPRASREHGVT
jgi:asparagine synthase (glutamine-hydrolysing)